VSNGGGRLKLGSGAFDGAYSLKARVEELDRATNPAELIAAAEGGTEITSQATLA
jgi:osmotically inducible protein OsmC